MFRFMLYRAARALVPIDRSKEAEDLEMGWPLCPDATVQLSNERTKSDTSIPSIRFGAAHPRLHR